LLTEIGLSPGGSSTVQYSTVQYSTVHYRTHLHTKDTQNKKLTTLVGRLSGIRTQNGQTKIND